MGQVIGFLSYDDFVKELQLAPDQPVTVRVQDYSKRSKGKGPSIGLEIVDFVVDVAAVHGDDLLICRFRLGGGVTWEDDRVERRRQGALVAAKIVTGDLERLGFDVRKGLFAEAKGSETEARPGELWHWAKEGDETVIVPGPFEGGNGS